MSIIFLCHQLVGDAGFIKSLKEKAVPEYFPIEEVINLESCRFCLKKIEDLPILIEGPIKFHYHNLIQKKLDTDLLASLYCCIDCYCAIRNSSFIKRKIMENQENLINHLQKADFVEIKMESNDSFNDEKDLPEVVPMDFDNDSECRDRNDNSCSDIETKDSNRTTVEKPIILDDTMIPP